MLVIGGVIDFHRRADVTFARQDWSLCSPALARFVRFTIGLESPLERRNMLNATIEGSLVVAGVQIVLSFVGVYLLELEETPRSWGLSTRSPFLFNALSLIIVSQSRGTPRQILSYSVRAGIAHRLFLLLLPLAPFWGRGLRGG